MSPPGAHELERSAVVVCTRGAVDRIAGMLGQIDDGQLPVFFFFCEEKQAPSALGMGLSSRSCTPDPPFGFTSAAPFLQCA